MKIIFIFSCSGMFRDVPGCSGMFRNYTYALYLYLYFVLYLCLGELICRKDFFRTFANTCLSICHMPSDVPVLSSVTHNFHISLQTELDQCGFSKKIGTVL